MSAHDEDLGLRPLGEAEEDVDRYPPPRKLDTFGGVIEVRWEEDAGVSMHGGLAFFIEFLKVSGIWEKFVAEFPQSIAATAVENPYLNFSPLEKL